VVLRLSVRAAEEGRLLIEVPGARARGATGSSQLVLMEDGMRVLSVDVVTCS